jgi:hypothetical protein
MTYDGFATHFRFQAELRSSQIQSVAIEAGVTIQ